MYNQEANPAYIGKPFQFGDYLIVVGIAVLLCPGLPDFLQGVDDNEPGVRVFPDKTLSLLLQATTELLGSDGKKQVSGGTLYSKHPVQPLL